MYKKYIVIFKNTLCEYLLPNVNLKSKYYASYKVFLERPKMCGPWERVARGEPRTQCVKQGDPQSAI